MKRSLFTFSLFFLILWFFGGFSGCSYAKKDFGPPECGDGRCSGGENCSTCPSDCACPSGLECAEGVCRSRGRFKCGDGVCSQKGGENCSSCPSDCACPSEHRCQKGICKPVEAKRCGDKVCASERGENCGNCPEDCPCPAGSFCKGKFCAPLSESKCGDSICLAQAGENCGNCPSDCGCRFGEVCVKEVCKRPRSGWNKNVRIFLLIFDPKLKSKGGVRLSKYKGWNDPDKLTEEIISDLTEVSDGSVTFTIVKRVLADQFPRKVDGFVYSEGDYLAGRWHKPDGVDYRWVIRTFGIDKSIDRGEYDEVWMWGGPYFGYWESTMGGPGAYFVNSPPIQGVSTSKKFIIMGLNYERGVGEALESFGHRAESILKHVYGSWGKEPVHDWNRFTLYDKIAPGQAACGNIHFAPNSRRDYDWGNPTPVLSSCDDWYNFPNLTGKKRLMSAKDWGGGDVRAHHKWWFRHLPNAPGKKGDKENNWWKYIFDYNRF